MNGQMFVALLHVINLLMSVGENLEILTATLMKMIDVLIVTVTLMKMIDVSIVTVTLIVIVSTVKTVTLMIADAISAVVVGGEDVAAVVELEDDALVV